MMSFFDPQKELTPEERGLSFEQFREMIRIARISIATAAPIFGVSDRTLKRYANDRHSCIDEKHFLEIVRLFRGLENYKRLFKQTANEQCRDYICAWRAARSGIIYIDEFTIFGYSGALDRFRDLDARARAGEGDAKYRILLTDGHRRFIFRILKNELVPVQHYIMANPPSEMVPEADSTDIQERNGSLPAEQQMETATIEVSGTESVGNWKPE
jgi:hypothetical protein